MVILRVNNSISHSKASILAISVLYFTDHHHIATNSSCVEGAGFGVAVERGLHNNIVSTDFVYFARI